jgi:hypothetical protein
MDTIARIVTDVPHFHSNGQTSWAVNENVLREIQSHVGPASRTLETGCGASTVLFAALGCNHVCITPSRDEADRVAEYARKIGFSTDKVKFLIGSSDYILPGLSKDEALDLVLIDGAHRFPYPAVDFHYVEHRMKIGSVVVVDDVQIRAVAMLAEFLNAEEEWKQICLVQNTAFYRKLAEPQRERDWCGQRLNDANTSVEATSLWRRALTKSRRIAGRWR